jgi:hypothetical protein
MSPSNSFPAGSKLVGSLIDIVDASGNPATFKNPPVWSSSDSTVLNPVASSDGLSATATALKTGSVTITVVGDGVTATYSLSVTAGSVVSFQIQFALAPAGS